MSQIGTSAGVHFEFPKTPSEACARKDCATYFRLAPGGPIYSRDRQRTLLWARGGSGRQKRKIRKELRRMASSA